MKKLLIVLLLLVSACASVPKSKPTYAPGKIVRLKISNQVSCILAVDKDKGTYKIRTYDSYNGYGTWDFYPWEFEDVDITNPATFPQKPIHLRQ